MAVNRDKVALREKDLNTLLAVFARFPEIAEVRIFGSRATGMPQRASDIDLAVTAPEMSPGTWARFVDALEEAPIIYLLDVLRMDTLADERMRQRILEEGVLIYRAPRKTTKKQVE